MKAVTTPARVYVFGYGSLCWRPSPDLASSVEIAQGILDSPFRRVWAQYSCDHRGTESNYGVVCNLLKEDELKAYYTTHGDSSSSFNYISKGDSVGVLGTLYLLPDDVREQALADLDVREKGGYSREIVQVSKINPADLSLTNVTALLYRGQAPPDDVTRSKVGNFWGRLLYDDSHQVAVMSSSVGPSGWNGDYIFELDAWLKTTEEKYVSVPSLPVDDTTKQLATKINSFIDDCAATRSGVLFLYVLGNNEHGQLGLENPPSSAPTRPFDHAKPDQISEGLWESHIVCPSYYGADKSLEGRAVPSVEIRQLQCGGSHSGVVTRCGKCYLFGSNGKGQLGLDLATASTSPLSAVLVEGEGSVAGLALGHDHTILRRADGSVRCFGNNDSDQCSPPPGLKNGAVHVAAGPKNSACVTSGGLAFVWGCAKYSQSSPEPFSHSTASSLFTKVCCGLRHTLLLDDKGKVWGCGDNRHGQLCSDKKTVTALTEIQFEDDIEIVHIESGWSHNLAVTSDGTVFGWGRNDKGQLGLGHKLPVKSPTRLFEKFKGKIKSVACGPETSNVMDESGQAWGCGWNEHGNLGVGDCEDRCELAEMKVSGSLLRDGVSLLAVGGAHVLLK